MLAKQPQCSMRLVSVSVSSSISSCKGTRDMSQLGTGKGLPWRGLSFDRYLRQARSSKRPLHLLILLASRRFHSGAHAMLGMQKVDGFRHKARLEADMGAE